MDHENYKKQTRSQDAVNAAMAGDQILRSKRPLSARIAAAAFMMD
jgi:hypothetical protein